uniref:Uncharacterized protein n=1 Tax=Parascaris univalens TaxID=6257 RepID=A0A915CJR5_PARUN
TMEASIRELWKYVSFLIEAVDQTCRIHMQLGTQRCQKTVSRSTFAKTHKNELFVGYLYAGYWFCSSNCIISLSAQLMTLFFRINGIEKAYTLPSSLMLFPHSLFVIL